MSIEELLPETFAVLQDGIQRGHHFGGQLAMYRGGELLINDAFGRLGPDTDEPVSPEHVYCWRSAGKPWTAVVALQFIEEGELSLELTLDEYLPPMWYEDGVDSPPEDSVIYTTTLRHVLTHTTGWEPTDIGWPELSVDKCLERVINAKMREGVQPGSFAAYDPNASWFALGEFLATMCDFMEPDSFEDFSDGDDVDELNDVQEIHDIVRERVFEPAGVEAFLADKRPDAVDRHLLAPQFDTNRGANTLLPLTTANALFTPSPGSSCRGPIVGLAKLYDALLANLQQRAGSPKLLSTETVRMMTERHRKGMVDATFQHKLDFGLGVIVNSNRYGAETVPYGFGRYASESAFGHGGAQCAMGFADPEHDLAVGWVLNGLAGEPRHNKRNREINSAIYADLGLAER